ncbi:uncharacterized protein LOC129614012 isoform X2 [Condylostylus longicornis]|uniref:uncharacterized protein LOC129614012 isoform X2 n=1 Tax=Condylostylus longicornis TaxID=2530218 RepID=UPI00244DFBE9|nr:uncharacterized protein LOC129614012 isoform X2 [Condylostylus longicornis]
MMLLRFGRINSLRSTSFKKTQILQFCDDKKISENENAEKKGEKKTGEVKEESSASKLNRLLASMSTDDNTTLTKKVEISKPGARLKPKKTVKKDDSIEKKPKNIIEAAKNVAEALDVGADQHQKRKTESELLSKLLNHIDHEAATSENFAKSSKEVNLNDIIVGMKIDRKPTIKDDSQLKYSSTRSQYVRRALSGKQFAETSDDRFKKPRRKQLTEAVPNTGSVNLFGEEPLGIFKDPTLLKDSPDILKTWSLLEKRELKLAVTHPPRNYFEKMILWTEQGKLWKFPIDNEQGLEEEQSVDFSEHVFLDQHLEGWCPTKGPVRHFMELVCVGLSKNPYITAQEKRDHIYWFKEYFQQKEKLLKDLIQEKEQKQQIEQKQLTKETIQMISNQQNSLLGKVIEIKPSRAGFHTQIERRNNSRVIHEPELTLNRSNRKIVFIGHSATWLPFEKIKPNIEDAVTEGNKKIVFVGHSATWIPTSPSKQRKSPFSTSAFQQQNQESSSKVDRKVESKFETITQKNNSVEAKNNIPINKQNTNEYMEVHKKTKNESISKVKGKAKIVKSMAVVDQNTKELKIMHIKNETPLKHVKKSPTNDDQNELLTAIKNFKLPEEASDDLILSVPTYNLNKYVTALDPNLISNEIEKVVHELETTIKQKNSIQGDSGKENSKPHIVSNSVNLKDKKQNSIKEDNVTQRNIRGNNNKDNKEVGVIIPEEIVVYDKSIDKLKVVKSSENPQIVQKAKEQNKSLEKLQAETISNYALKHWFDSDSKTAVLNSKKETNQIKNQKENPMIKNQKISDMPVDLQRKIEEIRAYSNKMSRWSCTTTSTFAANDKDSLNNPKDDAQMKITKFSKSQPDKIINKAIDQINNSTNERELVFVGSMCYWLPKLIDKSNTRNQKHAENNTKTSYIKQIDHENRNFPDSIKSIVPDVVVLGNNVLSRIVIKDNRKYTKGKNLWESDLKSNSASSSKNDPLVEKTQESKKGVIETFGIPVKHEKENILLKDVQGEIKPTLGTGEKDLRNQKSSNNKKFAFQAAQLEKNTEKYSTITNSSAKTVNQETKKTFEPVRVILNPIPIPKSNLTKEVSDNVEEKHAQIKEDDLIINKNKQIEEGKSMKLEKVSNQIDKKNKETENLATPILNNKVEPKSNISREKIVTDQPSKANSKPFSSTWSRVDNQTEALASNALPLTNFEKITIEDKKDKATKIEPVKDKQILSGNKDSEKPQKIEVSSEGFLKLDTTKKSKTENLNLKNESKLLGKVETLNKEKPNTSEEISKKNLLSNNQHLGKSSLDNTAKSSSSFVLDESKAQKLSSNPVKCPATELQSTSQNKNISSSFIIVEDNIETIDNIDKSEEKLETSPKPKSKKDKSNLKLSDAQVKTDTIILGPPNTKTSNSNPTQFVLVNNTSQTYSVAEPLIEKKSNDSTADLNIENSKVKKISEEPLSKSACLSSQVNQDKGTLSEDKSETKEKTKSSRPHEKGTIKSDIQFSQINQRTDVEKSKPKQMSSFPGVTENDAKISQPELSAEIPKIKTIKKSESLMSEKEQVSEKNKAETKPSFSNFETKTSTIQKGEINRKEELNQKSKQNLQGKLQEKVPQSKINAQSDSLLSASQKTELNNNVTSPKMKLTSESKEQNMQNTVTISEKIEDKTVKCEEKGKQNLEMKSQAKITQTKPNGQPEATTKLEKKDAGQITKSISSTETQNLNITAAISKKNQDKLEKVGNQNLEVKSQVKIVPPEVDAQSKILPPNKLDERVTEQQIKSVSERQLQNLKNVEKHEKVGNLILETTPQAKVTQTKANAQPEILTSTTLDGKAIGKSINLNKTVPSTKAIQDKATKSQVKVTETKANAQPKFFSSTTIDGKVTGQPKKIVPSLESQNLNNAPEISKKNQDKAAKYKNVQNQNLEIKSQVKDVPFDANTQLKILPSTKLDNKVTEQQIKSTPLPDSQKLNNAPAISKDIQYNEIKNRKKDTETGQNTTNKYHELKLNESSTSKLKNTSQSSDFVPSNNQALKGDLINSAPTKPKDYQMNTFDYKEKFVLNTATEAKNATSIASTNKNIQNESVTNKFTPVSSSIVNKNLEEIARKNGVLNIERDIDTQKTTEQPNLVVDKTLPNLFDVNAQATKPLIKNDKSHSDLNIAEKSVLKDEVTKKEPELLKKLSPLEKMYKKVDKKLDQIQNNLATEESKLTVSNDKIKTSIADPNSLKEFRENFKTLASQKTTENSTEKLSLSESSKKPEKILNPETDDKNIIRKTYIPFSYHLSSPKDQPKFKQTELEMDKTANESPFINLSFLKKYIKEKPKDTKVEKEKSESILKQVTNMIKEELFTYQEIPKEGSKNTIKLSEESCASQPVFDNKTSVKPGVIYNQVKNMLKEDATKNQSSSRFEIPKTITPAAAQKLQTTLDDNTKSKTEEISKVSLETQNSENSLNNMDMSKRDLMSKESKDVKNQELEKPAVAYAETSVVPQSLIKMESPLAPKKNSETPEIKSKIQNESTIFVKNTKMISETESSTKLESNLEKEADKFVSDVKTQGVINELNNIRSKKFTPEAKSDLQKSESELKNHPKDTGSNVKVLRGSTMESKNDEEELYKILGISNEHPKKPIQASNAPHKPSESVMDKIRNYLSKQEEKPKLESIDAELTKGKSENNTTVTTADKLTEPITAKITDSEKEILNRTPITTASPTETTKANSTETVAKTETQNVIEADRISATDKLKKFLRSDSNNSSPYHMIKPMSLLEHLTNMDTEQVKIDYTMKLLTDSRSNSISSSEINTTNASKTQLPLLQTIEKDEVLMSPNPEVLVKASVLPKEKTADKIISSKLSNVPNISPKSNTVDKKESSPKALSATDSKLDPKKNNNENKEEEEEEEVEEVDNTKKVMKDESKNNEKIKNQTNFATKNDPKESLEKKLTSQSDNEHNRPQSPFSKSSVKPLGKIRREPVNIIEGPSPSILDIEINSDKKDITEKEKKNISETTNPIETSSVVINSKIQPPSPIRFDAPEVQISKDSVSPKNTLKKDSKEQIEKNENSLNVKQIDFTHNQKFIKPSRPLMKELRSVAKSNRNISASVLDDFKIEMDRYNSMEATPEDKNKIVLKIKYLTKIEPTTLSEASSPQIHSENSVLDQKIKDDDTKKNKK